MSIRILFMGVIAGVTGQKEVAMSAEPGTTLRSVLDRLEALYGAEFGRRVFRSQREPRPLQMHTRIFVNGTIVTEDGLDRPMPVTESESPEVLIYLLPAATGG